jgi:hypothetical protein
MIDFFLASIVYLGVMFVVAFCFSFMTIAIAYSFVAVIKRCHHWSRQPGYVLLNDERM